MENVRPNNLKHYFSGEQMLLSDVFDVIGSIKYGHDAGMPGASKNDSPSDDRKGKGKLGRKPVCAPLQVPVKDDNNSHGSGAEGGTG